MVLYCYLFLLSVFILWFSYYVSDIFCVVHIYLLYDFVATLRLRIALCIVFCFVQASTVTTSLQQLLTLLYVRLNVLFYVSHFCSYYSCHLPSIYVFSYFPFGFGGRMWDLIVSYQFLIIAYLFTSNWVNPIKESSAK